MIRVGTAGWSIPNGHAAEFPKDGSALQRYAARFDGVEINSTFYRRHRPDTFVRWAAAVPPSFRFALKVPRTITHERRLVGAEQYLDEVFDDALGLGEKLGPLLVQLPPSLRFDAKTANSFFRATRERFDGSIVCEPRHLSWFQAEASDVFQASGIGRVAADPEPVPGVGAADPEGDLSLVYFRLHGSPRMYHCAYGRDRLAAIRARILAPSAPQAWCIFDNTASGAALRDALMLADALRAPDG